MALCAGQIGTSFYFYGPSLGSRVTEERVTFSPKMASVNEPRFIIFFSSVLYKHVAFA